MERKYTAWYTTCMRQVAKYLPFIFHTSHSRQRLSLSTSGSGREASSLSLQLAPQREAPVGEREDGGQKDKSERQAGQEGQEGHEEITKGRDVKEEGRGRRKTREGSTRYMYLNFQVGMT